MKHAPSLLASGPIARSDAPVAGDASFDAYVEQHRTTLVRLSTLLCGSRVQGEDIVHDVLIRLYPKWDQLVAGAGNHHAYVRRSIVNEHISWRRRWSTRNIRYVDDESLEVLAGAETTPVAAAEGLWQAVQELPKQQRAALVLRYNYDLDDAEIADILGCRPGTVRVYISRALATLRQDPARIHAEGEQS